MARRKPDEILAALEAAGFAAYYVGGCVRDALLGRETHDWDVATSARPEQVLALFDRCVPTGVRHGTVTVLLPDTQAEVTTFRRDGAYLDSRHPQAVSFVSDLKEDLLRRDFTRQRRGHSGEHGQKRRVHRRLRRLVRRGIPHTLP